MRVVRWVGIIFFFLSSLASTSLGQSSTLTATISTYAGPSLPVIGSQAVGQPVDFPSSVVPDSAGGFYVVSHSQHRVYYVAADGTLHLTAGTGSPGFSGDGGPAAAAQLNDPWGAHWIRLEIS